MRIQAAALVLLFASAPCIAADPSAAGLWKTVDDKTHKTRGLIRLYENDGVIFGKIEYSFDPKEALERCDKCEDDRKDKPIIGLIVMRQMRRHGSEYSGGDILDPETGSIYKCKMNLEDGGKKLVVRGYIGFSLLGRSQTWFRQE